MLVACGDPSSAEVDQTDHDGYASGAPNAQQGSPAASNLPSRPGDAPRWVVARRSDALALVDFRDPAAPKTFPLTQADEQPAGDIVWSRSGANLAFVAQLDERAQVIVVRVDSGEPERVGSWQLPTTPAELTFLGDSDLIARGAVIDDYTTGKYVYQPSFQITLREDEPVELGGLQRVAVSGDERSALGMGEELFWIRVGEAAVRATLEGLKSIGLSRSGKSAVVSSTAEQLSIPEELGAERYDVPENPFVACVEPTPQYAESLPHCRRGNLVRFESPVWSPNEDGFVVPLSFSPAADVRETTAACGWLNGAVVDFIGGVALNYFPAGLDAASTHSAPSRCVSVEPQLYGRGWGFLSDGRMYWSNFIAGSSPQGAAAAWLLDESRVYLNAQTGAPLRSPSYFTLGNSGYLQHLELVDDEETLLAVAYHRASKRHRVYSLDVSRPPDETTAQSSIAQLVFEIDARIAIITSQPNGHGVLIGAGGFFIPISHPKDRDIQAHNTWEHEVEYHLVSAPGEPAIPLASGLWRPTWIADGSGLVSWRDDTIVYIPKDAPDQLYPLASSQSWTARWTP